MKKNIPIFKRKDSENKIMLMFKIFFLCSVFFGLLYSPNDLSNPPAAPSNTPSIQQNENPSSGYAQTNSIDENNPSVPPSPTSDVSSNPEQTVDQSSSDDTIFKDPSTIPSPEEMLSHMLKQNDEGKDTGDSGNSDSELGLNSGSSGGSGKYPTYQQWYDDSYVPKGVIKDGGIYSTSLQTGAATYLYPINVPPGTNGLAPIITLSYSSQSANSPPELLGAGWSITENYIMRDINYTPIDKIYRSDDRLILNLNGDSQMLFYSGKDGHYHTKIENYMLIYGSDDNWTAIAKDGTKYRFGINSNSILNSNLYSYVVRWYLSEIEDTHGNKIFYEYKKNPFPNDFGYLYPYKITYNNDKQREIEFIYESTDRPDMRVSYAQGNKQRISRRLSEISIKAQGNLIRKYKFGYETDSVPSASLLSGITLIGKDGSTFPKTTFSYYKAKPSWIEAPSLKSPFTFSYCGNDKGANFGDFNGDGKSDLLYAAYLYDKNWEAWTYTSNGSEWKGYAPSPTPTTKMNYYADPDGYICRGYYWTPTAFIVDVNGDGKSDILSCGNAIHGGASVWLSNGSGWVNSTIIQIPDYFCDQKYRAVDLNGDGKIDFVKSKKDRTETIRKTYIANRTGWYTGYNLTVDLTEYVDIYHSDNDLGVRLFDVNGDGMDDIVVALNDKGTAVQKIYYNTGSGWEEQSIQMPINFSSRSQWNDYEDTGVRMADINGDGLADLIYSKLDASECKTDKAVFLNTGSGWIRDDLYAPHNLFPCWECLTQAQGLLM